jgi:5'(3')-deoxyribonucleotidase
MRRPRPTVLLDVDGVLADFTSAVLALIYDVTGRRYQAQDVTTWEVFDSIPEKEAQAEVYRILKGRGGCLGIPVCDEAKEGVARLREVADIVIVTSPFSGSETWVHERNEWLYKHFGIERHDVIHANKKARIHGDVFIDDKPEHVDDWLSYWGARGHGAALGLLWASDRTITEGAHLMRVNDWSDVMEMLRRLRGEKR